MLYEDIPIKTEAEDILHRQQFIYAIEGLIRANKQMGDAGFVIGLEGSWGSGKTSILNILEKDFTEHYSDEFVVVRFDSWLTSDCASLTVEFFKTLRDAAPKRGLLHNSSKMFANFVKNISISFPFQGSSLKIDFAKRLQDDTLREQKNKIVKKLSTSDRYIVCIIDDLDRLSHEQILYVMQLVKNIADFPRVIYILAYDREILTRALGDSDGENGESFIEKVVQLPISMPELYKRDIGRYFFRQLKNIICGYSRQEESELVLQEVNGNFVEDSVYKAIIPYLKDMRSCKRILNAFQTRYSLAYDFCNDEDLMYIVILTLYEPNLITYIIMDTDCLYLENDEFTSLSSNDSQDEYRKSFQKYVHCSEEALHLLELMFPVFAKKTGRALNNKVSQNELIIKDKIAFRENFLSYFAVPNGKIPSYELKQLLLSGQEFKLRARLEDWAEHHQWISVYKKIEAYCDIKSEHITLTENRLLILLHVISSSKLEILSKEQGYSCIFLAKLFWRKFINSLFLSGEIPIGISNMKKILQNIFCDPSISSEVLSVLMKIISQDYRNNSNQDSIIDQETFEMCNELFTKRKD